MLSADLLKKVRQLHIKTSHLVDAAFAGTYQSAFRGQGMEFQEVRQYVPGDDIRSIDWNVTAKTGIPHVKVFQEERELTVMLLLDMSASGLFASSNQLKRNLIAEIAAVLAFSAIRNNDKVGVILFTDHIEKVILPKKGRGHVWRVIREILTFKSGSRSTDIGHALQFLSRVSMRKSICFLLSDFIDDKPYDRNLSTVGAKHDLISLIIRDTNESELPKIGFVNVVDPETGNVATINTSSPRLQRAFTKRVQEKNEQISALMTKAGGKHLFIYQNDDYIHKLVELFQKRRAI